MLYLNPMFRNIPTRELDDAMSRPKRLRPFGKRQQVPVILVSVVLFAGTLAGYLVG